MIIIKNYIVIKLYIDLLYVWFLKGYFILIKKIKGYLNFSYLISNSKLKTFKKY